MAAILNMASSQEVVQLYRQMLRVGKSFTSYNFRYVWPIIVWLKNKHFTHYSDKIVCRSRSEVKYHTVRPHMQYYEAYVIVF